MAPKRRAAAVAAEKNGTAAEEQARYAVKRARKGGRKEAATDGSAGAAAPAAVTQQQQQVGKCSYYLVKSEPDVFSIDDLEMKPGQTEHWDGVRSHQAKKVMQGMRAGDRAFFYHSNAKPPGVVGVVEVVREAYPDHTQFVKGGKYYDASSQPDNPKWFMVDIKFERRLARQLPLEELKRHSSAGAPLAGMALFKYGRLSVQPVSTAEWEYVLALEAGGESGS